MAEEKEKEGGIPELANFTRYRNIKQELYDQLTDEERLAYEEKAAELNKAHKALPERSEIFEYVECLPSAKGSLAYLSTTETNKTWSAELRQHSAVSSGRVGASMAKPPSLFKPHSIMQTMI